MKIIYEKKEARVIISQSLIKDALPQDVCPKYIQFKYILCVEGEMTDAMFRGRYFEWHLLGAVRGGEEPVYPENQNASKKPDGTKDKRPKEQYDLDILVDEAARILRAMKLDPDKGEKQLYLEAGNINGNIDWKTADIQQPDRKALYDVKYTETKYDDRWNGWADFETNGDAKIQAVHYVMLHYAHSGQYLPFYFLVFGKGGWVRVIKVEVTSEGISHHEGRIEYTERLMKKWARQRFAPNPSFNKCVNCPYKSICPDKSLVPEVEIFQV